MKVIRSTLRDKRIIKIYLFGFKFDLDKIRKMFIPGFRTAINRKHKAKRNKNIKSSLKSKKGRTRIRNQLIKRDGECCNYCKIIGKPLQVDHVIPLNILGIEGDVTSNKQLLCEKCHVKKTKKEHPKL